MTLCSTQFIYFLKYVCLYAVVNLTWIVQSLGDPSNKENAEFEAQRQGAIAEAARGGARKVFGGGNKPVFDRNLRHILDIGYTQEQAEMALKQSKNNVDQAVRYLKVGYVD